MMMKVMSMFQKKADLGLVNMSSNYSSPFFLNTDTCLGMRNGLKIHRFLEVAPVLERLHRSVLSH